MQVGKVDRWPHFTEYPVTDPAKQSQRPPDPWDQAKLEHPWVFTPAMTKQSTKKVCANTHTNTKMFLLQMYFSEKQPRADVLLMSYLFMSSMYYTV